MLSKKDTINARIGKDDADRPEPSERGEQSEMCCSTHRRLLTRPKYCADG